jgi:hypothetical protein
MATSTSALTSPRTGCDATTGGGSHTGWIQGGESVVDLMSYKLTLHRDVEIGEVGAADKEVVAYRVRGYPRNADIGVANMRMMGMAGQWRIRREGARDYEPKDYATAEDALAALQAEADKA